MGSSSDTWKTGWIRESSVGRLRRKAFFETCSIISDGPMNLSESFLVGRVVRRVLVESKTLLS